MGSVGAGDARQHRPDAGDGPGQGGPDQGAGHATADQAGEKQRVNKRFDEELVRLRQLWGS